jgi:hypothetical protein
MRKGNGTALGTCPWFKGNCVAILLHHVDEALTLEVYVQGRRPNDTL